MKTSVIISAVLIGVSALAFASKDQPAVNSVSKNPGKFYGLIVNTNANIILTQGETNCIRIEGENRDIKNIDTEIQNGSLVINGQSNSNTVNIHITFEDLDMIEVNDGGKLYGMGTINSDILLLKVTGEASMKVDVRSLKVAMIAKGNGKLIVSGSTGESFVKEVNKGKIFTQNLNSFSQVEDRVITNYSENNSAAVKL